MGWAGGSVVSFIEHTSRLSAFLWCELFKTHSNANCSLHEIQSGPCGMELTIAPWIDHFRVDL